MTRPARRASPRLAGVLSMLILLTGCSADPTPDVTITIGNTETTLEPTLYCVDGQAKLADEGSTTTTVQVQPDQQITVTVPDEVAEKSWAIQIWSVREQDGSAVPAEQIGNIPAGTQTSFGEFTTSDAAPDRYFIIVAVPEDPNCTALGAGGIWTLLVARTA